MLKFPTLVGAPTLVEASNPPDPNCVHCVSQYKNLALVREYVAKKTQMENEITRFILGSTDQVAQHVAATDAVTNTSSNTDAVTDGDDDDDPTVAEGNLFLLLAAGVKKMEEKSIEFCEEAKENIREGWICDCGAVHIEPRNTANILAREECQAVFGWQPGGEAGGQCPIDGQKEKFDDGKNGGICLLM